MALIKSVRGFTPQIGENCYLADNATVSTFKTGACYTPFIRNQ